MGLYVELTLGHKSGRKNVTRRSRPELTLVLGVGADDEEDEEPACAGVFSASADSLGVFLAFKEKTNI